MIREHGRNVGFGCFESINIAHSETTTAGIDPRSSLYEANALVRSKNFKMLQPKDPDLPNFLTSRQHSIRASQDRLKQALINVLLHSRNSRNQGGRHRSSSSRWYGSGSGWSGGAGDLFVVQFVF